LSHKEGLTDHLLSL